MIKSYQLKQRFLNILKICAIFIFSLVIAKGMYDYFHCANKLTKKILLKGYKKYSSYTEQYLNTKQYIQHFPVSSYSLYTVKNFATFYLEETSHNDVIKSVLFAGNRWEPNLIPYMNRYIKKGTTVLDIGAHIGTHTVYFAQILNGTGTVWAFEPQAKLFFELNANLFANHVNNVKTLRYALGDKQGTIEMNQTQAGNEGGTSIGKGGDKADIVTLDSLHIKNISFIKIDVEGYEDHVLAGATQTIKESKPVILCEIMGGNNIETATPIIKEKILYTINILKALGYQVNRISVADYLAIPQSAG